MSVPNINGHGWTVVPKQRIGAYAQSHMTPTSVAQPFDMKE